MTIDPRASHTVHHDSGAGVIVYSLGETDAELTGTFVLRLYGGALATETARRRGDRGEGFVGDFDIDTLTPAGGRFATGTLHVSRLGDAGAYDVTYVLEPVEECQRELGFTPGTKMVYKAVGMGPPAVPQLVVAWDNDEYVRVWEGAAMRYEEWGYRRVTATPTR